MLRTNALSFRLIAGILLVCFSFTTFTGCYTYSAGEYLRTEKIPSTRKVTGWSCQVSIQTKPTPVNPTALLRIEKVPRYKVKAVKKYEKIAEINKSSVKAIRGCAAVMALGGLCLIAASDTSGAEEIEAAGIDFSARQFWYGLGLILSGVAAYEIADTNLHTKKVVGSIRGEERLIYEDGVPTPLATERVVATARGSSKTYITDSRGQIKIDLVNDLGLGYFSDPERVTLELSSPKSGLSGRIILSSRDWTVPYFRVGDSPTSVYTQATSKSWRLGKVQPGEEYKSTGKEQSGWQEIEYMSGKGWVAAWRGSEFWAAVTREEAIVDFAAAGGLSVDIEQNIPKAHRINRDAVAVIIGNRNYQHAGVPTVDYALRDATIMREYLIKTFGYREGNIIFETDATQGKLLSIFGTKERNGKLHNYVKKGKSDIFIYYSGHGAPDPETKDGYFVPTDCDPSLISVNGYSLDLFYSKINQLDARSITVVIDACFSGASAGGMLLKNISPVFIEVDEKANLGRKGVVFTSATGEQVSSWYPEKKHSLFTYYFLKAVQGEADVNQDEKLTANEIKTYIDSNVPYLARRLFNREQTPQLMGETLDQILVEY